MPNPVPSPSPAPPPAVARRPRRHGRLLRRLVLLVLVTLIALAAYPPVWRVGLRSLAAEAASRRGLQLEVGAVEGSPFNTLTFRQVRLHGRGTDLRVRQVDLHLTAPAVPYFQRPKGSLLARLVVEGLEGEAVLTPPGSEVTRLPATNNWTATARERFSGWTAALAGGLVPSQWSLLNAPTESFTLTAPAAGGSVRARGLRLSTDDPGSFSLDVLEARGPGQLTYRAAALRGTVGWRGTWLTIRDVELSPGVTLAGMTIEAVQLVRRGRLEGEATVRALGGELRAQGTAGPGMDGRPNLAVACSLNGVAVLPMAELLGVAPSMPLGGTVRAGQFSFRGDPARAAEGTGSLVAEVLDFRFGNRAWQRLRVAASVLSPRATVHELKLVQGANVLNLEGEFPVTVLADPAAIWRTRDVQGRMDAHLEDLRAFHELLGPAFPVLTGRLDLRGELHTAAGGEELPEGDFHLSGGPLSIRGVALDRLRADVRLRHGEGEIEKLEAMQADDTLSGKATFRLAGGPFRYTGEGRAHVKDLTRYAGAFPPGMFATAPRGSLTGEWSGDGGTGGHAGTFKGRVVGLLIPPGGPGALPRPVDLDAEGTYSPESLAFRRFSLRDPGDPKAEFHLRLENAAVPWTQSVPAWMAGHVFQPDGALAGRVEARDLPLDLVFPSVANRFGLVNGTDGRLTGWVDLAGTPRVPRFTGAAQLRRARVRWRSPGPRWADMDALAADLFLEGGDHLRIERGTGERAASSGGGAFTFGGRMEWAEREAPLGLDLTIQGKNVGLLDSHTARVRGDLDLTVRGLHNTPEIAGEIRLREGGRFWRQLRFTPVPTPLPPAVVLSFPAITAGPFADAEWNLHVTNAGPLMMEGAAGFRGELRPDLKISGTGRLPLFQGGFSLRRAKLSLPAAEMDLEEGNLGFDPGGTVDDLTLNFTAFRSLASERRNDSGTRLRADFSGPVREGVVAFSAEPPNWSPAEVAAFLVEGKIPPPTTTMAPVEDPSPAPKLYLRLR